MKQILDIETTGLCPGEDDILQLAIIDQNGVVLFSDLFRSERHSSWPDAERINHISPGMVKGKQTFEQRAHEIQEIIDQADELIAYNAGFDLDFLAHAGINLPDVPVSDPMLEFAEIYGEWDSYHLDYRWQTLETAARYYGYAFKCHDALEDARATLFVYGSLHGSRSNWIQYEPLRSVFVNDLEKCILCGKAPVHLHHVFYETDDAKKHSKADGFIVPLCPCHHRLKSEGVHNNTFCDLTFKGMAQRRFERTHIREEFIVRYGRSYI